MMIFENQVPGPPLHEHIESLIYFKGYQPEHTIERKVPDGAINLIFELDGLQRTVYENESLAAIRYRFTGAWIAGMHRKYITFSAHPNSEMFVILFKPGGAYPFLKRPVHELTEKIIDAPDIFGAEINDLRERLLLASDFTAGLLKSSVFFKESRNRCGGQGRVISRDLMREIPRSASDSVRL